MADDVRSEVVDEFLKGGSFYDVVMWRISAVKRLIRFIVWALSHKGNVVIELDGMQRHGKSTVGRLLCLLCYLLQCKFEGKEPNFNDWENYVVYRRKYSAMTNEIRRMVAV